MTQNLIYLALAILAGFAFSYLARLVRLPNVTGYLVGGLLLGITGIIPKDVMSGFDIISDVALGFIAFSIGSEFKLTFLKKVGAAPIIIMLLEAFMAVLAVAGALLAAGFDAPLAIMLGRDCRSDGAGGYAYGGAAVQGTGARYKNSAARGCDG